jgi:hypothetical protein
VARGPILKAYNLPEGPAVARDFRRSIKEENWILGIIEDVFIAFKI